MITCLTFIFLLAITANSVSLSNSRDGPSEEDMAWYSAKQLQHEAASFINTKVHVLRLAPGTLWI